MTRERGQEWVHGSGGTNSDSEHHEMLQTTSALLLLLHGIGEALEFSDLRALAAFFEDGPGRDVTTLHNVRFCSVSYLDDHTATGFWER